MSDSVKELCEFIWSLEEELDLLNLEADGVKFWHISRMKAYYLIAEKIGLLERPHNIVSDNKKIIVSLNYFKNAILSNPFSIENVDALIVEHPRAVQIEEGKVVDVYTYFFANELRAKGVSCKSIEPPYLGEHVKSSSEHTTYLDRLSVLAKFASFFYQINEKPTILSVADIINKKIFDKYSINIDLSPLLVGETKSFVSKHKVCKWFLKRVKPKTLYLVVSYGYFHFVKAAKELGINVIELQHGTYSKYHLGYSYPNGVADLTYIPDYLYVWNDYWKKSNVLPITREKVLVTGFLYGEEKYKKYKSLVKKKQIVILSQGVIGKQLSSKLDLIIERHPEHEIYYKLHPGEYGRWMDYPLLNDMMLAEKVHVIENTNLYKLLAESEFQIGVFSTALFEGMALGCKTILVDLPGIEYMEGLIKSGEVYDIY